jgi:hypothetical protein
VALLRSGRNAKCRSSLQEVSIISRTRTLPLAAAALLSEIINTLIDR